MKGEPSKCLWHYALFRLQDGILSGDIVDAGAVLDQRLGEGIFRSFEYLLWVVRVSPFGRADVSFTPIGDIRVGRGRYLRHLRKASAFIVINSYFYQLSVCHQGGIGRLDQDPFPRQ